MYSSRRSVHPGNFTTSQEGEPDTYHNIQDMYVGKIHKLKGVQNRCVKYDMKDTLKIPSMIDETTTDPEMRWGNATTKR